MATVAGEGTGADAGRGALDVTGVVKKPSAPPRPGARDPSDRGRSGYDTKGVTKRVVFLAPGGIRPGR